MSSVRAGTAMVAGCALAVLVVAGTGAGVALAGSAAVAQDPAGRSGAAITTQDAALERTLELAPIVAAWPDRFSVEGGKSEPLYTERISFSRDGDLFALTIEVIAQGDTPLGTQRGAVSVADDGAVEWVAGCTKDALVCADDPMLRGFLATAAIIGLERSGRLPASGIARTLHGTPVICVDDDALHPDAEPSIAGLNPCFSESTGALLGHWSDASAAFVGPTLAPGFREATEMDRALFAEVLS